MAEVWNLDQLEKIGGHTTTKIGEPIVGTTEKGKAVFLTELMTDSLLNLILYLEFLLLQ